MREHMKQQIKDMLSTLGRAEAILDSRTKKKEEEDVVRLLEDMQASAIAIGSAIEQVEGDGTETVKLLEDYCELLWQYMMEEDLKERFRRVRLLAGKRGEINASLESGFEVRLEIVFLVCRSQGWKQMERFYCLMKDKADCYVLTAAYKEGSAGGKEHAIHGESGTIPDSVRVLGFEDYDFQERKPDMVFVDGPYDLPGKKGAVPDYDFMKIRESAGIVLYAPCYEDGSQAEETHCWIPQVLYSDIIIVPSGKVNDIYMNTLGRMENGRDLIKKVYVLDEDRALSDVLAKQMG